MEHKNLDNRDDNKKTWIKINKIVGKIYKKQVSKNVNNAIEKNKNLKKCSECNSK